MSNSLSSQLNNYLNDDELDLSMAQIEKVPVKEISNIKKAKQLDLSQNIINELPKSFCSSLSYLTKLDLSKNRLTTLPENIGLLQNLITLDLYSNNLSEFPITICELKKLKWLDVKDNPLKEDVRIFAGNCLDKKECQLCARNIKEYYVKITIEIQKQENQKLEIEAKLEREKLLKEKQEKKLLKEAKRIEKQLRREEFLRNKENEVLNKNYDYNLFSKSLQSNINDNKDRKVVDLKNEKNICELLRKIIVMTLIILFFLCPIGLLIYLLYKDNDIYMKKLNYWLHLIYDYIYNIKHF